MSKCFEPTRGKAIPIISIVPKLGFLIIHKALRNMH